MLAVAGAPSPAQRGCATSALRTRLAHLCVRATDASGGAAFVPHVVVGACVPLVVGRADPLVWGAGPGIGKGRVPGDEEAGSVVWTAVPAVAAALLKLEVREIRVKFGGVGECGADEDEDESEEEDDNVGVSVKRMCARGKTHREQHREPTFAHDRAPTLIKGGGTT